MSSPFPFSSPTQASHFVNAGSPISAGRVGGNGQDHSATNLNSPIPSPYFSPYASSFQSPSSNNPFVGVNSPGGYGPNLSMGIPLQDTFYGGGTPAQSPQLYSSHPSMTDSPRTAYPTSPWSPTTSWASGMLPAGMNNSWLGLAGMGFTNQPRPKLTTTLWEDENTVCYQVDAKGICVARRQDNDMVNGTKLLNVTGMSRGKRDGILKNEKGRVVVKVGAMHLKGVWITFQRAKALAAQFKIADLLYPLFVEDPSPFLYNPHCPPNVGVQQVSAPSGAHAYMSPLGSSAGSHSKPPMPYGGTMSQLNISGQELYTSQGISHTSVGSSPNIHNTLHSSPLVGRNDNDEVSDSSHNSPSINSDHYSKFSSGHFIPPAEPNNKALDVSGRPSMNLKKRIFDDSEDSYGANHYSNGGSISSPLAKPMSTHISRNFTSFPSPLTLSPNSLPSPSIAQPNSSFYCDISPSMNKRIKLPNAAHFITGETNESHDFSEPSTDVHREQNYDRPHGHNNSLHPESLGLLFETLSPPESENENVYETADIQYEGSGYDSGNSTNSQRFDFSQALKQPQS